MFQPAKFLDRMLSVRLSLIVVLAIATLLMAALLIMFQFSWKAVKKEALCKAEQTLETTVEQIDNVLLSVEQATGNMMWNVYYHMNEPDRMFTFAEELVTSSPYIDGCAIAFEPYYYKERGKYFMAYVYRSESGNLATSDAPVIKAETFGDCPYNEQSWYTSPMQSGMPNWIGPLKENDESTKTLITFALPLYAPEGKKIGVMGVDVSISVLSEIVLAAKPSVNSYATLLSSDGSFIVHPDSTKLTLQSVFKQTGKNYDPTVKEAAEAMVSGQTGYKYVRLDGRDCYVFYKPFKRAVLPARANEELGWSIGIICPEDDIFGENNRLLYSVMAIAAGGLLLLLLLCTWFIHRQLTPLQLLTQSAQRIAEGRYDDPVPDSRQKDEIGRLQDNFQRMQQSLAVHIGSLKQLNAALQQRGEVLSAAYEKATEADRMKTAFLHNMTDQMIEPVSAIVDNVGKLCNGGRGLEQHEANRIVEDIQQQGNAVTTLLNDMLRKKVKR